MAVIVLDIEFKKQLLRVWGSVHRSMLWRWMLLLWTPHNVVEEGLHGSLLYGIRKHFQFMYPRNICTIGRFLVVVLKREQHLQICSTEVRELCQSDVQRCC